MRRTVVAVAVALATMAGGHAAYGQAKTTHFKNCTDMHRVYKGGVARSGAVDHRSGGGHARYRPKVSTALYNANSGMDRDGDRVACEQ